MAAVAGTGGAMLRSCRTRWFTTRHLERTWVLYPARISTRRSTGATGPPKSNGHTCQENSTGSAGVRTERLAKDGPRRFRFSTEFAVIVGCGLLVGTTRAAFETEGCSMEPTLPCGSIVAVRKTWRPEEIGKNSVTSGGSEKINGGSIVDAEDPSKDSEDLLRKSATTFTREPFVVMKHRLKQLMGCDPKINIQRGSIVIARNPCQYPGGLVVKRVTGIPGDRIQVRPPASDVSNVQKIETRVDVVPEGCYFLEGDNELSSTDSRNYGPVHGTYIRGVVSSILWPRAKEPRSLDRPTKSLLDRTQPADVGDSAK